MYAVAFHAVSEDLPGPKWQAVFHRHWPAYRKWFLAHGGHQKVTYLAGIRALKKHMPELMPSYERLVDLAGGGDMEARFLSMWCPPVYIRGCSQAALAGAEPVLIRNYDYPPALIEGTWLATRLNGRRVIAMSDCLWGALDGINESGLAVSLAFGGKKVVGEGFGIPLVLRYVLEVATNVAEATAILARVPVHMCYSVTLLDKEGRHATVFLSPGIPAEVTNRRVATNVQRTVEWPEYARATMAVERADALDHVVHNQWPLADVIGAFFTPPIFQSAYDRGYGTLYTALYRPLSGEAQLLWQDQRWTQGIGRFEDGMREITLGAGVGSGRDAVLAPLQPTMFDTTGATVEVTSPRPMRDF